jgi:hypothetical protein
MPVQTTKISMNNAVRPLRSYALATLAWLAVPVFCVCLDIFTAGAWAAEGIRSLHNVCQWNAIGWSSMTLTEHQAWMALGWTPQRWESNKAPASSSKDWNELTASEQSSARQLGYSPPTWSRDCK